MQHIFPETIPARPAAGLEAAQDWERQLTDYLEALSEVQSELLELLERKRRAMAARNLGAFPSLQRQEEALSVRLSELQQRRARLLEQAAREGWKADNLQGLAKKLDSEKQGKLHSQVNQVAGRMQMLQHAALTNWVIAQRSLLHISQMLEILATGGRLLPTYDPCGPAPGWSGGLVDQEA